jgi:hypothetical protein
MTTATTTPTNGVDRCECGCKYWNAAGRCVDCHPDPTPTMTDLLRALDAAMVKVATRALMNGATPDEADAAARTALAAHLAEVANPVGWTEFD